MSSSGNPRFRLNGAAGTGVLWLTSHFSPFMAGDDGELRPTTSISSLAKTVSTVRTQPRPSAIRTVVTAPRQCFLSSDLPAVIVLTPRDSLGARRAALSPGGYIPFYYRSLPYIALPPVDCEHLTSSTIPRLAARIVQFTLGHLHTATASSTTPTTPAAIHRSDPRADRLGIQRTLQVMAHALKSAIPGRLAGYGQTWQG